MENLELRKAVAEALGCTVIIVEWGNGHTYPRCGCPGLRHGIKSDPYKHDLLYFYDTDDHAALDALREFCEPRGFEWSMSMRFNFGKQAYYYVDIFANDRVCKGVDMNQAIAICKAIQAAAKG